MSGVWEQNKYLQGYWIPKPRTDTPLILSHFLGQSILYGWTRDQTGKTLKIHKAKRVDEKRGKTLYFIKDLIVYPHLWQFFFLGNVITQGNQWSLLCKLITLKSISPVCRDAKLKTGQHVKFKFQINKKYIFKIGTCKISNGTYLY